MQCLKQIKNGKGEVTQSIPEDYEIYESNLDSENLRKVLGGFLNRLPTDLGIDANNGMNIIINSADQHYTAMLRFSLDDKKKRKFVAERFCFRGAIDDWIYLSGPDNFRDIVKNHISTLGTDEFFDQY